MWGSARAHGSWCRAQGGLAPPCVLGAGRGRQGSGRRVQQARSSQLRREGAEAAAAAAGAAVRVRPLPARAGMSLIPSRREGGSAPGIVLPAQLHGSARCARQPVSWALASPDLPWGVPSRGWWLPDQASPVLEEARKGLRALCRASRPATLQSHLSGPFAPSTALPAERHFPAWLCMPNAVLMPRCPGDTSLPSSSSPLPPTSPHSLPTCPRHPCPSPAGPG